MIGGGIHGLWCACDAAQRGLATALVDAGDFGGAASFNHQKTAHGGLRSLQSVSLLRARESIVERRTLARVAPWLIRPLPFLVGTYSSVTRGRLALRGAFAIDGWLARDRNEHVEPELHLPRPRLLSRTATIKLFPGVRQDGLTGGAQWYDYLMVENDRLTFAVASAADRAGADLANYAEALSLVMSSGRVHAVRVRDVLTADEVEVRAAAILNTAGPGTARLLPGGGGQPPVPAVKALNLVTAKPASEIALAAPGRDGRMLTLVPWRGRAIVGTSVGSAAESQSPGVSAAEVERFLDHANFAFPSLEAAPDDITLVHRGLVPAARASDGTLRFLSAPTLIDHGREGVPNMVTLVGTKYTTARALAERATDVVIRKLGKAARRGTTSTRTLPGAGMADHEAAAILAARGAGVSLSPAVIRDLVARYAEAALPIIALCGGDAALTEPLGPETAAIGAEVIHAIRNESAARLTDVLLRRTTIGAAGHPGPLAVQRAAALAARELGWSPATTAREVESVDAVYRISDSADPSSS